MAKEKAEHIYAIRTNVSITRAVEQALSNAFKILFKSKIASLKGTAYYFFESVLTESAHGGGGQSI